MEKLKGCCFGMMENRKVRLKPSSSSTFISFHAVSSLLVVNADGSNSNVFSRTSLETSIDLTILVDIHGPVCHVNSTFVVDFVQQYTGKNLN